MLNLFKKCGLFSTEQLRKTRNIDPCALHVHPQIGTHTLPHPCEHIHTPCTQRKEKEVLEMHT